MTIQIIPFQDALLLQAAELLVARHRRDRLMLPALPPRFEKQEVALQAIVAVRAKERAIGFAAVDGETLVAYLIGDSTVDSQRGRSGWVRSPGCAYDLKSDADIIRDLYSALGAVWVAQGAFSHFVLLPVTDEVLMHAWFSMSFGVEQIHGLLDLRQAEQETEGVGGIDLRRARSGDGHHLASMSDVIWREQVKAPVWGVMLPETVVEVVDDWSELADDTDYTTWLAMDGDDAVGVQIYRAAEPSDELLHIPEKCIYLSVAGTRADRRGQGIGKMMTVRGLHHAATSGYGTCEADWRSTNLFASRFWPRRGFQPAVYRLVRTIDRRIAWATG